MVAFLHSVVAERARLVIEFGPAILFGLAWLGLSAMGPMSGGDIASGPAPERADDL